MNKRQMKKYIPADTEFCYQITGKDKNGDLCIDRCPHFKILGHTDNNIIDCKTPTVYCSYAKVSSEEDFLLLEDIKTCGERLRKI